MPVLEKLKRLWVDDRPLKKRFPLALLVGTAVSLQFVFAGIIPVMLGNTDEFPFLLSEVIVYIVLTGAAVFVLVSAILFLLKGVVRDVAVSLAAGCLAAGYLQVNFLNLKLGVLDGSQIRWDQYAAHAVLNTAVWIFLLFAPVFLRYLKRSVWEKAMLILCVLILSMQGTALMIPVISGAGQTDRKSSARPDFTSFLSENGINRLSPNKNTVIFIVDYMDSTYVDNLLESNPALFDAMEGFTYFPNTLSRYGNTYPSVAYLFTGYEHDMVMSNQEYFEKAWSQSAFLREFKDRGYAVNLYLTYMSSYIDATEFKGLADNAVTVGKENVHINALSATKRLMKLSAYRYAPQVFKASLWMPPTYFDSTVSVAESFYSLNVPKVYRTIKDGGLAADLPNDTLTAIHLSGAHPPYVMDENLTWASSDKTSVLQQLSGDIKLINEYIRQMKAMGIYDDATIVLTADHGDTLKTVKKTGVTTSALLVKPAGADRQPLAVSAAPVSHDNFRATVMDAMGWDGQSYGRSAFDISEDEIITRQYITSVNGIAYEVTGDARDFNNWTIVGE